MAALAPTGIRCSSGNATSAQEASGKDIRMLEERRGTRCCYKWADSRHSEPRRRAARGQGVDTAGPPIRVLSGSFRLASH